MAVFHNQKKWTRLTLKIIATLNLAGVLILFLNNKEMLVSDFLIYTLVGLLIVIVSYLRHIDRIEFSNGEISIIRKYRRNKAKVNDFQFREVKKMTRTLTKYNQLIIKNLKTNATFRIDSFDWSDYEILKAYLSEKKLLEEKNG